MEAIDKYDAAFRRAFGLSDSEPLDNLAYQGHEKWDSVGHMTLVATLEDIFAVALDLDDVIDFENYAVGKEILVRYGISF
jgi:acyl carrier protein